MLKQKTENKTTKEVFIGTMSEQPIPLEAVQDPRRPGHAKPGPYTQDEFAACLRYGLLRPDTSSLFTGLVELKPDPLEATAAEAPADLLADVEGARVAVESARAKTHEAAVARDLAWLRKKTEWERKRDWPSFQRAEHAEKEAVIRWLEAREDEEREVRRLLLPAEAAIAQWRHFESLRRRQMAYPPSPAPTGPSATIQTVGQPLGPPMITLS